MIGRIAAITAAATAVAIAVGHVRLTMWLFADEPLPQPEDDETGDETTDGKKTVGAGRR